MATSEAVEGILVWLEELRYPRLSTSRDSIAGLVRGEFGASLLWLSRHAVGRRCVRVLYQTRVAANVSAETRRISSANCIDCARRPRRSFRLHEGKSWASASGSCR